MPRRTLRRLLAMLPRQLWVGLTLLALVACTHQPVTVSPNFFRDIAPIRAQVDPCLLMLTERWATGGTSGEAPVGTLLGQILVDDAQAPLALTYATSRLDVTTVVSPRFYRPHAYQARYRIVVRVESPAIGARQAWIQGTGEGWSLASAARATSDAITQAVREFSHQLAAVRTAQRTSGNGL
jgi:hypothetical protein